MSSMPEDIKQKKATSKRGCFRVPSGILSLYSSDFVDNEPTGSSSHYTTKGSLATSFLGCPVGFEPTTFRTTI